MRMNIKPIIHVMKDGSNEVLHKARSLQKGMQWIRDYVMEKLRPAAQRAEYRHRLFGHSPGPAVHCAVAGQGKSQSASILRI